MRGLRGRSIAVSGVSLLISAVRFPPIGGVLGVGDRAGAGDPLLSAEGLPLAKGGEMLEESDAAGELLLTAACLPLVGRGERPEECAGVAGDGLLSPVRCPLVGGLLLREHGHAGARSGLGERACCSRPSSADTDSVVRPGDCSVCPQISTGDWGCAGLTSGRLSADRSLPLGLPSYHSSWRSVGYRSEGIWRGFISLCGAGLQEGLVAGLQG